ncbi:MAG: hypothetical protein NT120_02475, partial [Candidatus Aenigmarchaeota archaeon]|nr:hypothetical protein [Candidatus Aenigmarchaeota archaeon]
DTTSPSFTLATQAINVSDALNYTVNASDVASGVATYVVSDTVNFTFAGNVIKNATALTARTYQVAVNITDTAGNSNSQNLVITVLAPSQQYAGSSEIVRNTTTEVVVNQGSPSLSQIIVPAGVAGQVNLSITALQNGGGNATVPGTLSLVRESAYNYTAVIPLGTIISGTGWDGKIRFPAVKNAADYTAPSGNIDIVIDVGSSISLSFNQPVKIVIGGMYNKHAAWVQGTGTMTDITTGCNSATTPTNIPAGKECYINDVNGADLDIWTYHFTSFAAYTSSAPLAPAPPSSGGGGFTMTCTANYTISSPASINGKTGIVIIPVTIFNIGTCSDNVTITATVPNGWIATNKTSKILAGNKSDTVNITVAIPAGAASGTISIRALANGKTYASTTQINIPAQQPAPPAPANLTSNLTSVPAANSTQLALTPAQPPAPTPAPVAAFLPAVKILAAIMVGWVLILLIFHSFHWHSIPAIHHRHSRKVKAK